MTTQEPLEPAPPLTDSEVAIVQALKIPVDSDFPSTYWIASLSRASALPTADELRIIRSYIDFNIQRTYNLTYQERILAKPFPAEGGHNTVIFRKGARWLHQDNPREGWAYRRIGWDAGFWPRWPEPRVPLIAVLEHLASDDPRWADWKLKHPELFT